MIKVTVDEVFETPLTKSEKSKEILDSKIYEAKKYLTDTDFKMTVDYYATLAVEVQTLLTASRAEARAFLKANGY